MLCSKAWAHIALQDAEIEKLRDVLSGVLWMAEEWFNHGGDETAFSDDHAASLEAARAELEGRVMADCKHCAALRAEVERLRADIAYADKHAEKVESLLWGTAKEREKLRAALERLLRAKNEKDAHGDTPVYQALKAGAWDEARAVLSASQPAPSPWRLIETAPTDGTVVLVFAAERDGLAAFQCTAAYHEDAGWCVDELREVTHWMPLPPPPQKENSND